MSEVPDKASVVVIHCHRLQCYDIKSQQSLISGKMSTVWPCNKSSLGLSKIQQTQALV